MAFITGIRIDSLPVSEGPIGSPVGRWFGYRAESPTEAKPSRFHGFPFASLLEFHLTDLKGTTLAIYYCFDSPGILTHLITTKPRIKMI